MMNRDVDVTGNRKAIIRMLVRERKEMKITQETLAERIGIERANLSRFERGAQNPSLDFLLKYALALGKTPDLILKNNTRFSSDTEKKTEQKEYKPKNMKPILKKIEEYKQVIDSHRPLTVSEIKEYDNYLRIGLTYSSNAIEGNTLTLSETKVLLEDGLTVGGKPLRDCYETTGHAAAFDYMVSIARDPNLTVTEDMIRRFHKLFYEKVDSEEAGQYRDHQVFITGTEYIPPKAEDVPAQMKAFVEELERKKGTVHPIELAAYAHRKLVDIHPFADGNGRTARLLMNMILINQGYQPVSISPVMRLDYYAALRIAQRKSRPSDEPFITLIAECENEAQRDYCRMFSIPMPKKTRTDRDER